MANLNGQVDLVSAIEGTALPGDTDVASFTDDNLTDTSSAFTATIDWGDGVTTTNATIIGSNGNFTVEGGHTYADDDFVTPVVTVTRTADSTTLTMFGGVNVSDADNLAGQPTPVLTGSSGVQLTNVTVGIFSDTYHGHPDGSDFTTSIDWGDGTVTTGTVTGSGGSFTVLGTHTYATDGQFTITTFLNDDSPDASFANVVTQADIGFGASLALSTAAEFETIPTTTTIATFSDNTGDPITDYTATIDWGDGTVTNGVIVGSGGSYSVASQTAHTYADEGDYTPVVTINRAADGSVPSGSTTATGTLSVLENDSLEVASTATIKGAPGVALTNVQLATFTDNKIFSAGPSPNVAGDFIATVDWGDGTTTAGTVTGGSGSLTVSGSHTYAQNGTENISVFLSDDPEGDQATANAVANATAFIGIAPQSSSDISGTEGTPVPNTQLATFTDSNTTEASTAFSASIDWGDGLTSAGTVTGSNGTFTVSAGPHTYADEGLDLVTTTVTHSSDSTTISMTGQASIADADHLVLTADNFSGSAGSPLNNVQVATFTDTYLGQTGDDLVATIDWGDGNTSGGTITGSNGSFTVTGSNTYTAAGTDTFTVSVVDDGFGTASASGNGTATIAARTLTGTMVLNSTTEGTVLPNTTTVATFTDTITTDTASDFTATIDWGDGLTTAGTVVGSNGSFSVQGGHTYADEGSDPAVVTLTHTADNAQGTASGNVDVGEADVLTGEGTKIKANIHHAFSGVVATFSDTYTGNDAGDFNATINWGDGTVTGGTVTGGGGTFTVSGTHQYAHPGHENVTVTLNDDAPGTATATANSTANVSSGAKNDFNGDAQSDLLSQFNQNSAHPDVMVEVLNGTTVSGMQTFAETKGWQVKAAGDFNVDGKEDIVLEKTDGSLQVWLMNGTSVTSTVNLPSTTSSWHVIAADDFNGDGEPDLLFQNDGGQVGIWTMDGTSVVSMMGLSNPGSSWHVIGAGDFNGDGNADILFQNSNGTPMIWEMNGTSIVSQITLSNPGSQWKAVGTGDFNGDGNADILFQKGDASPMIWEMNGGSVIASATLTGPGNPWTVIGTSDFNGDGNADILFQRNNGIPMVWEMNGTSVVSSFTLPNPGPQWKLQADGPIQSGGTGGSAGTPHLSTPDLSTPDLSTPVIPSTAPLASLIDTSVPGTQNYVPPLHLT